MLHFIKGRAGSGKTEYLREIIRNDIDSCNGLLIVPEQFSFETERSLLKMLGAQKVKKISIMSFSRLAFSRLRETADFSEKKMADDGIKKALMSEALLQLGGELEIYNGNKAGGTLLSMLVDFNKELKFCRVGYGELTSAVGKVENLLFKQKINELVLINEAYDALLAQSYFDDSEALELYCRLAAHEHLFAGKKVYIDGFRAFSKQELECLRIALCEADDVYITLCTAAERARTGSAFEFIKDFEIQLRSVAAACGVSVDEIYLEQNSAAFSGNIAVLEKSLYSRNIDAKAVPDGSITVAECSDMRDECKFVAREIRKLMRLGYRCRDIAVIERRNGTYKSSIIAELKRSGIPVFDDSRRPLTSETLFVYVSAALQCLTEGFTSENVLKYLKSGLSPLDVSEVSELENYSVIWNINGKVWLSDFTMHPEGFGSEFNEKARQKLVEINALRARAVNPLIKLKNACTDKSGGEICAAVYNFLINEKTADRLYGIYTQLRDDGFPVEAERQRISWDILMKLLDTCNSLFGDKYVSLARWFEIFSLLVSSKDIGEIPQGLDEVTVGSADRIRTESIKAAFLVGVNKNEFPLVEVSNNILTDNDRRILTKELNIDVRPSFADTVSEERFIAYCAVTAASEKLCLSYRTVEPDGAALPKSELCEKVFNIFDGFNSIRTADLSIEERIETDENAFSELAGCYSFDCSERAALIEYFNGKSEYRGKLAAIEAITGTGDFSIKDHEISKGLFGENIYISATRIEHYFKCPFAYFMRHGLGVEELRTATFDPMQNGTVVHLVLEEILTKYPGKDLLSVDDDAIKTEIRSVIKAYLNEKMGGTDDKSERFLYIYERVSDSVMSVIGRMKIELEASEFEPRDFELEINDGEKIPAYILPLDEGKVRVRGSVDRVDVYEKDGIKYLRIIDYKTGAKDFKLFELFYGVNTQMVLYLMTLVKNGKEYYGDTKPAGVLYMPARTGISDYLKARQTDNSEIQEKRLKAGKLQGMILNNPVVFNGMGVEKLEGFLPIKLTNTGAANASSSKCYTEEHFKRISEIVDGKLIEMGNSLHNGIIRAFPFGKDGEGESCEYCEYKAVCGHEDGDAVNEYKSLKHNDALKELEETKE